jgi:hypothetical protein
MYVSPELVWDFGSSSFAWFCRCTLANRWFQTSVAPLLHDLACWLNLCTLNSWFRIGLFRKCVGLNLAGNLIGSSNYTMQKLLLCFHLEWAFNNLNNFSKTVSEHPNLGLFLCVCITNMYMLRTHIEQRECSSYHILLQVTLNVWSITCSRCCCTASPAHAASCRSRTHGLTAAVHHALPGTGSRPCESVSGLHFEMRGVVVTDKQGACPLP